MFGLGSTELLIILLLVVVFFGAKRLPQIGKALGRMGNEYKSGRESAFPGHKSGQKQESSGQDASAQEAPQGERNSGPDIEAEIKNQLLARMPGLGRINRLKKTAEVVSKVARAAEGAGSRKPDQPAKKES